MLKKNLSNRYKYKVSIIVPCYNTKPWLDDCLQSLVDQTLQNIEIICVNDGSTDGSGARLEEWQAQYHDKIKVIHQQNCGLSNARNAGMVIAQGECIGFVDSDDFIDVSMYEKMYKVLIGNHADVVLCNHLTFKHTISKKTKLNINIYKINNLEILIEPSCIVCGLYKKKFIQQNKIQFEPNVLYEDHIFRYDIAIALPTIFKINDKLYYYRKQRLGQITSVTNKNKYDVFKIFKFLDKRKIKDHSLLNKFNNILLKEKLALIAFTFLTIDKKYKIDFFYKSASYLFTKYKVITLYKHILQSKYSNIIHYLLAVPFIVLLHSCYLYQKISSKKINKII